MPNSPAKSEPTTLNLPMLSIDFRSGSVEMQHGPDVYRGVLPMTSADRSQINTARGVCLLEKISSESLPVSEG